MLYKFCPKCAGGLKEENENLLICRKCEYHFYISPQPTACALIVNNDNEILLVKRAVDPAKNKWDLPGGFVDINESAEECLKRELKEELAIDINNFVFFKSYPDRYLYQGVNKYALGLDYIVEVDDKIVLKPADDISEAEFFSKENVPWVDIAFPNVRRAVEDFFNR